MRQPIGKRLSTFAAGALFVLLGVDGLRVARAAELQHTGVFFKLAWMSPLQAYIASGLCLAMGLGLMISALYAERQR
jgi:hypothetical protein